MAQNISHQVNIPGLPVKSRSVGAAELVGGDSFSGDGRGIFLYHFFYCIYADPFSLAGKKQGVFMAGVMAFLEISR